jgi:hypothetical protein
MTLPFSHAELRALNGTSAPRGGLLEAISQRQNGGRAVIVPGGKDARLISISAGADPNPYVVTVCLFRKNLTASPEWDPLAMAGGEANALPRARITWGSGKSAQTVLVDYLHGSRLTLDCSSVTIDAIYGNFESTSPPVGPTMEFYASVVYGSLGSRLATLTEGLFATTAPLPAVFAPEAAAIPDFANQLKLNCASVSSVFTVRFGSSRTTVAGIGAGFPRVFPLATISTAPNEWIQIPNGAEFVDVIQTAGTPGNLSLQYQLNL